MNSIISEYKKNLSGTSLKLFEEGCKYLEMRRSIGQNWIKEVTKVYIIDKVWLKTWKEYIDYEFIKRTIKNPFFYDEKNQKVEIKYEIKKDKSPGEITNLRLIYSLDEFHNDGDAKKLENIVIRHDIDQKKLIKFIPVEVWNFFEEIYGGGPQIVSPILEEKIKNATTIRKYVELYLSKFNICFMPRRISLSDSVIDKITIKPLFISKKKSVSDMKTRLMKIFLTSNKVKNDDLVNMRLWKFNSSTPIEELKQLLKGAMKEKQLIETDLVTYMEYINSRLDYINCGEVDVILVEFAEKQSDFYFAIKKLVYKEGVCPGCSDKTKKMLIYQCSCKEVWYCSDQCKDSCYQEHQAVCKNYGLDEDELKRSEKSKMGLVGLQNLGNTCFMNTSLQCISSCSELTNYFLTNHFKKDINEKNPIGTKGILARAYANLLKNMWYGEKNVYSPWNFKRAVSTFQPMFSGYQQHDTQEFLNYVLDGLHEDLNRVVNKPLVEKDDSKKVDNVKSLEQWYGFLLRNQSTLVDLLYGQFKSTLYCPNENCQNISTTFDPFLSISLPLTNKTEPFDVKCFFIFYDISIIPIELLLPFSSECTIMAFRNKIAKILNVHPFSFIIVKMDSSGNYDHLVSSTSLLKINNYYANENQKPFFLFQIDPNLFYSEKENKIFTSDPHLYKLRDFSSTYNYLESRVEENKKLFTEDYEEDESNATVENSDTYYAKVNTSNSKKEQVLGIMKINTDDNHGFNNDYLRLVVHLTYYNLEKSTSDNVVRDRIIFPRIIYVKTDWTFEQIHYAIFDYFLPILNKKKEKNSELLWKKYFSNLENSNELDSYEFQKKSNYPYRIKIKNVMSGKKRPCVVCSEMNCSGCLLPFSSETSLKDLLSKYPKNEVGLKIDNTYLYMAEFQRKYHQMWNRDFSLELCWLPEYKSLVHNLNEKADHDFKLQRSDLLTGISIYNCWKNFVKLEKLEDMNEWYCPNCKTHQKATKKMEIYKSPHILIIHLKRFKNMNKIDCLVDYPIVELNLQPFVINNEENLPLTYDLFAVANHVGNTGFGHYYAYTKNPFTGLWYRHDDSNVTPLSQTEIVSSSAYVLFYRRRNLEHLLDLGEIYRKSFINYETLMKNVEMNIKMMNQISNYTSYDI